MWWRGRAWRLGRFAGARRSSEGCEARRIRLIRASAARESLLSRDRRPQGEPADVVSVRDSRSPSTPFEGQRDVSVNIPPVNRSSFSVERLWWWSGANTRRGEAVKSTKHERAGRSEEASTAHLVFHRIAASGRTCRCDENFTEDVSSQVARPRLSEDQETSAQVQMTCASNSETETFWMSLTHFVIVSTLSPEAVLLPARWCAAGAVGRDALLVCVP